MSFGQPQYYSELPPFLEHFRSGRAVLVYHKLGFPSLFAPNKGLYVSPRLFEKQLAELKEAGFVSGDLAPSSSGSNAITITFDDGYRSTFEYALEPLARHGFKAIQFISTAYFGKRSTWDHSSELLMDKEHIREWLKAGHSIGSHTATHVRLSQVGKAQAREEIFTSRKILEDEFGVEIQHFCYPYGDWNEQIADWVAEAGYLTASTSDPGINTSLTNPFAIKRIHAYVPLRKWKGLYYFLRR